MGVIVTSMVDVVVVVLNLSWFWEVVLRAGAG